MQLIFESRPIVYVNAKASNTCNDIDNAKICTFIEIDVLGIFIPGQDHADVTFFMEKDIMYLVIVKIKNLTLGNDQGLQDWTDPGDES